MGIDLPMVTKASHEDDVAGRRTDADGAITRSSRDDTLLQRPVACMIRRPLGVLETLREVPVVDMRVAGTKASAGILVWTGRVWRNAAWVI